MIQKKFEGHKQRKVFLSHAFSFSSKKVFKLISAGRLHHPHKKSLNTSLIQFDQIVDSDVETLTTLIKL